MNDEKILDRIRETLPHSMKADFSKIPSLEESREYIYTSLDFTSLRMKLTSPDPLVAYCWSEDEMEIGLKIYKNFLFLNVKHARDGAILPPSLEIDEIWHHHILDTRSYFIDCFSIFGYYFHHYPYFGMRGSEDKKNLNFTFSDTLKYYEEEFGEGLESIFEVEEVDA